MSWSRSAVVCDRRVFFGVWLGGVVEGILALEERLDADAVLEMFDPPV